VCFPFQIRKWQCSFYISLFYLLPKKVLFTSKQESVCHLRSPRILLLFPSIYTHCGAYKKKRNALKLQSPCKRSCCRHFSRSASLKITNRHYGICIWTILDISTASGIVKNSHDPSAPIGRYALFTFITVKYFRDAAGAPF